MTEVLSPPLRKLAAAYGIQTHYYAIDGTKKLASPRAVMAVLEAMGAGLAAADDVEAALTKRRSEMAELPLPPLLVVRDEASSIRIPDDAAFSGGVELENGGWIDVTAATRSRLGELPWGYHRLEYRAGSHQGESIVIRAPSRAFRRDDRRKRWGLFAPVYALKTADSLGAGDFTDLARFVDWTARRGGGFVSTLPFLASFADEPSPYSPLSRLFWNENYIDPRRTPEWAHVATMPVELSALRLTELVDYQRLASLKRPLLDRLAREAVKRRASDIDAFRARFPEITDFARFRSYENQEPTYHVYCQMAAEEQLARVSHDARERGVDLYLDLPLGVHPTGYDVERRRELFALEVDVGAPPDAVFTGGQNWGFPPIAPGKSRASAHRYFRQVLEHSMRHAHVLRVDHVMGLHRQYWIPRGCDTSEGVYVRYPADELYAILCLESHRSRCEIVGENLGIVPEFVNERLGRHGVRGIYLLQYSLTGDRAQPTRPVPARSVASLNNHDTPLFAAFCAAADAPVEAIRALDDKLGVPAGDVMERLARWIEYLMASEADLVSIALEDLWLETEPVNVPGTSWERPNWRRPLRYTLEAIPPEATEILKRLHGGA